MSEKASSIFPAADILMYYETNAIFDSSDRGFIIEKGFQEWLLASIVDNTEKTAATEQLKIRVPYPGWYATDLVILIANLIGGAASDSV